MVRKNVIFHEQATYIVKDWSEERYNYVVENPGDLTISDPAYALELKFLLGLMKYIDVLIAGQKLDRMMSEKWARSQLHGTYLRLKEEYKSRGELGEFYRTFSSNFDVFLENGGGPIENEQNEGIGHSYAKREKWIPSWRISGS